MSLHARLDSSQRTNERRGARRRKLWLEAEGAGFAKGADVVIHDLSEEGMLLECAVSLNVGERLEVHIPEAGDTLAAVVWTSGKFFGCKFDDPLSSAAVSAALLRSPSPPSETERSTALYVALVELRALAKEIERITDRVDSAINRLNTER